VQQKHAGKETSPGDQRKPEPVAQEHDGRESNASDDEAAALSPRDRDAGILIERQCHEAQRRQSAPQQHCGANTRPIPLFGRFERYRIHTRLHVE